MPSPKLRPFNACVLDIETSELHAVGGGFIICAVLKPFGAKSAKIFRYDTAGDEPFKETHMLTRLCAEIERYDFIVGHNLANFDFPFIKTRAMSLKIPFVKRPFIYDTLQGFRRTGYRTVLNMKGKPTASLDMVTDLFRYKQQKTKIYPNEHWACVNETGAERSAAMRKLIDHCVKDVLMNERIFWSILEADYNAAFKRAK